MSGGEDELGPEEEAALAREALAEGDVAHALHHASNALAGDPAHPALQRLLEEVLDASDDPLELTALGTDEDPAFTEVAARAWALARRRREPEALDLVLQVIVARPDLAYESWALDWLRRPGVATAVDEGSMTRFATGVMSRCPGEVVADPDARAVLKRLLPVVDQYVVATASARLMALRASLARKLGRFDEAVAGAGAAYRLEPGWFGAIALAMAHRARGDSSSAVAAFERALEHAPDDLSARLDLGDVLCGEERLEEGLRWYDEVLAREPDHPWALPSSLYVRYLLTGDPAPFDALTALAPSNERAAGLLESHARRDMPYVGYLPEPSEATTNVLSQLLEKGASLSAMALTSLESPSSRLALARAIGPITVTVETIQTPDPRQPRGPVDVLLWRYDGSDPSPAVEPPDPAVAARLAGIAASPYDLGRWWRQATALGAELGPARAADLLGTMVHPPGQPGSAAPARPATPDWLFVHRIQLAAMFAVAGIDAGWRGSVRRRLLLSLARGPMDWTVEAAVVTLGEIARDDETAGDEVRTLLGAMLETIPRPGACCYEAAVAIALLNLPGTASEERARLEERLLRLEGRDTAV